MADEQDRDGPEVELPSTSTHEDEETSAQADVEPDTEVGEPPPPSNGDELDGDERPIQWRPGRRHGRSAESQRRGGGG